MLESNYIGGCDPKTGVLIPGDNPTCVDVDDLDDGDFQIVDGDLDDK